MAKFQAGQGGRPKGKPNKITGNLREWINDFINGNREQVESDFKTLEPKERIAMFEKLLKYTLPTLQATTEEDKKTVVIKVTRRIDPPTNSE